MSRGLTIAVWVFCVNVAFTVLNEINPFVAGLDYSLGDEMIGIGVETAPTAISFLGIPEIVNALNVFMDLILGPFRLVPQIMDMIGITGIINISAYRLCVVGIRLVYVSVNHGSHPGRCGIDESI